MQLKVIQIGNSKGFRLNKAILEKYNIKDHIELVFKGDYIELRPVQNSREGWAEQFKLMHEMGDDNLLIDDVFEEEDLEEWK